MTAASRSSPERSRDRAHEPSDATQASPDRSSAGATNAGAPDRSTATLDGLVRRRAIELGFDVVGVARADEPLDVDHERYLAFVQAELHGNMGYLARFADVRRRLDTSAILEGARSVICVGRRYGRPPEDESNDARMARSIARYARGQDYHGHVRKKLKSLAAFVASLSPNVRARALCDIEPVLERAWASRSGIGFIGKNGLVITPGHGSYQILGEVVTTLELVADTPIGERCGACVRCLEACPTQAFLRPFVLDPRKCIAYWTIEDPGPPPASARGAIGEHLFGCDVCQDVCPYNRAAQPSAEQAGPFRPLKQWDGLDVDDLCSMDEPTWDATFRGTPLRRARRSGVARSAVVVASNRLIAAEARGGSDEPAQRAIDAALRHDDPMVREVASDASSSIERARAARDR